MNLIILLLVSTSLWATKRDPNSASKDYVLQRIETECVAKDQSGASAAEVKAKCACARQGYSTGVPLQALLVISDHYAGSRNFDTPMISDEDSLALDIYHDVHSECMAKARAR